MNTQSEMELLQQCISKARQVYSGAKITNETITKIQRAASLMLKSLQDQGFVKPDYDFEVEIDETGMAHLVIGSTNTCED
jgi:hypothetical protein